jgi:recombinational DNA repair ATPase RecF
MGTTPLFAFSDTATFDQNLAAFSAIVELLDPNGGRVLAAALPALANETQDRTRLLNDMFAAMSNSAVASQTGAAGTPGGVSTVSAPRTASTSAGWFLEEIEIEGFRGINNEGAPLRLKFKADSVNSISAPNAVGKSSIYDALSFAITGKIPKLDDLLQSERPEDYYLNRFHSQHIGTVKLTLRPDNGGNAVSVTVTRTSTGLRNVSGSPGIDPNALLTILNREFVLLDAATFRSFIDERALERGRSFSGLLGLQKYSTLRQQLQALANTRAFNTHFDVNTHSLRKTTADRNVTTATTAITRDYQALVKESLPIDISAADQQQRCHAALSAISLLRDQCSGQTFMSIDIDTCLNAIKTAEGGPKRELLVAVVREEEKWDTANRAVPADADLPKLAELAVLREEALARTSGDLLRRLYKTSEEVMSGAGWSSPTLCPTCEKDDGTSVLDSVRSRLSEYDAVEKATQALAEEWASKGWGDLAELETLALAAGESPRICELARRGEAGTISSADASQLATHVSALRSRAVARLASLAAERLQLQNELPPLFAEVTSAVETARRLQSSWKTLETAETESNNEAQRATRVERLKALLEATSTFFAQGESTLAASRLSKVEPLCQTMFADIMFSPVVPALRKPQGSEELSIRLSKFWGLNDVSAQALLSESYRNAFAVSVYLAAASLFGGSPRFVVLDDVTSSFDAGHQHHLVEVIRTKFSRPLQPNGPQVILLSHDTLLEKLFNKHSGSTGWSHQRLEGTARTAVLPQSGAVNKVRDATIDLLNAGRVDDAAPRIRQYLEYVLQAVIGRCRVPVPPDIAFGDDKRTPGELLKAIEAAVDLEKRAGSLILDATQVQNLQVHSATIIGNFLAHWSTGQTQAFSAPALLGVMQATDRFPECFQYEPTPGAPKKYYSSLNRR